MVTQIQMYGIMNISNYKLITKTFEFLIFQVLANMYQRSNIYFVIPSF